MRIPKRPPDTQKLFKELLDQPERMLTVLQSSNMVTQSGKYDHWDKLRYHKPPDGISLEEWWMAIKMARSTTAKTVPLVDTQSNHFMFGTPDPVPEHLHHIDQDAAGRIETVDEQITNPAMRERYIYDSLVAEAITSSQLEGAFTTRRVAKEMLRTKRRPIDHSETMIRNNYVAMKHVCQLKDKPLTEAMLLELHAILTDGTLDDPSASGRFRRSDERITVSDIYNEIYHTPPDADELPQRLAAMLDFANEKTPKYFLHPVVRSIILHFWLAYDHPFVDGNGRCARTLFYWSMLRQGYWLCEFLSISQIIKKAPSKYETAFLYTETDENDLTYFILYHLNVIRRSINELHEHVSRKTQAMRQTQKMMRAAGTLNHRQLVLLTHALRHPDAEYSMRSHQVSHNVTYQTARMDLYNLVKRGLLTQQAIGRTFYFYPAKNLERRIRELQ
ncbi:MAG: Fic family protein [Phycisphaerae bacterium]|nr:Fic family protein [Planctomycetota bacterium]MBL7220941.1 Fic family protein [Phycisphaerae bacterium]